MRQIFAFLFFISLSGCFQTDRANYKLAIPKSYEKTERLRVSLEALNDLIGFGSSNAEIYFERSRIQLEYGNFKEALQDINTAIDKSPNNPDYFFLKAKLLNSKGEFPSALSNAQAAESRGMESAELSRELADLLIKNGKLKEAEVYIEDAYFSDPYDVKVYYLRGMSSVIKKDTLGALEIWKNALTLGKPFEPIYDRISDTYYLLGKVDSSFKYNKLGLKEFTNDVELNYNKGQIFERLGMVDSALVAYNDVLNIDSSRVELILQVGQLYFQNKYYTKALRQFETVINRYPNLNKVYYLAGLCSEKLKKYEQAREFYLTATTRVPEDPKLEQAFNRANYLMSATNTPSTQSGRLKNKVKLAEPEPEVKRKFPDVEPLKSKKDIE